MEIRNVSSRALEIAATGHLVEPGDTVDIEDDAIGAALLDQIDVWQPATDAAAAAAKKAAAKAAREARKAEREAAKAAGTPPDDENTSADDADDDSNDESAVHDGEEG